MRGLGQVSRAQGRLGRVRLGQQRMQIQRLRDHGQVTGWRPGPLLGGQVPIQFDSIVVRIAEIERVAHAMVRHALHLDACPEQSPQRIR